MLGSKSSFITEVKVELQKASWPWEPKEKGMKKYKELVDSTLIVVIAMLLLSGVHRRLGIHFANRRRFHHQDRPLTP